MATTYNVKRLKDNEDKITFLRQDSIEIFTRHHYSAHQKTTIFTNAICIFFILIQFYYVMLNNIVLKIKMYQMNSHITPKS